MDRSPIVIHTSVGIGHVFGFRVVLALLFTGSPFPRSIVCFFVPGTRQPGGYWVPFVVPVTKDARAGLLSFVLWQSLIYC